MFIKFNKSIIFFLSIFALNLSFYYFGENQYFYPKYKFFEIIKASFIASSLLTIPIITYDFISKKKEGYILNFINSLFFSFIFYLIFHTTIRFADYNFVYLFSSIFEKNYFLVKVFIYSIPFLISFIILIFLKQKQLFNFYKFIFIYLIIINCFSLFRLSEIYIWKNVLEPNNTNDYNSFNKNFSSNIDYSSKKVFLFIFDEFDQMYFEKNLQNFQYLKNIFESSYSNETFYAPAMFTLDSIPAILLGSSTKKTSFKDSDLYLTALDNTIIKLETKNSIFNQPSLENFKASIFGHYHPYCKNFIVKYCYDVLNYSFYKITLYETLLNISSLTYLQKFINVHKFIDYLFSSEKKNRIKNKNDREYNESTYFYNNSIKFLANNDTDLIYIHFPFPHPPLKTDGLIKFNKSDLSRYNDYEKNLFLVENTISNLMVEIEKYQNSLLIITSDHWLRQLNNKDLGFSKKKPYPSVFISKIMNDNEKYSGDKSNNGSSIKKLIELYYNNKILNNRDIMYFFKNQKNHKSYVK